VAKKIHSLTTTNIQAYLTEEIVEIKKKFYKLPTTNTNLFVHNTSCKVDEHSSLFVRSIYDKERGFKTFHGKKHSCLFDRSVSYRETRFLNLPLTNTLAYLTSASVTKKKVFIVLAFGYVE
jgi:hypothetical protein